MALGVGGLAVLGLAVGCGDTGDAPPPIAPVTTTAVVIVTETAPQGPSVARPEGFPNGGERVLLAGVGDARAGSCTRESPRNRHPGSRAGVYCDLRDADGVRLYVDLFPTSAGATGVYARYRTGRRVPVGAGACAPEDGGITPGEGAWSRGRVMCFAFGGDFWLVFTDVRRRELGFVVADGDEPVRAFFRGLAAARG